MEIRLEPVKDSVITPRRNVVIEDMRSLTFVEFGIIENSVAQNNRNLAL